MLNDIENKVFNLIEGGDKVDLFKPTIDDVVSKIYEEYPVLEKYNFKVEQTGSKGVHGYPVEYFSIGERDNPFPESNYIGLNAGTNKYSSEELESAIFGDMLHALKDDDTWSSYRNDYLSQRSTEDIALDQRVYKDAVKRGDTRSYVDWMNISRGDAYVREALKGNPEWLEGINSEQVNILDEMKTYLKTDNDRRNN